MKKILSLMLVMVAVFALAGCQKEDTFEVALLVPGAVTDGGWSQSAYEGLLAIEEEVADVTILYTENVTSANSEKVMSDYARADVELVIGHGMEYFDIAEAIKDDYPDTAFVITSTQNYATPNVGSIWVNTVEMGFISGYMAYQAGASELIFFEGAEYTAIVHSGWGTMAGFEYAAEMAGDSNIKNEIIKMNNTSDVQAAQSLAITMAESADWNADELAFVSSADDATRGAILAAEELEIPFIGFYASKQEESDWVMMDIMTFNTSTFVAMAETVKADNFVGQNYLYGVVDEIVVPTEIYDTYAGDATGLQAALDALVADISSGDIDAVAISYDWAEAKGLK